MELLTVQEVAKILKVSPVTIRRHIDHGDLSAVRVGRRVRVPKEALDRLVRPLEPRASPRKRAAARGKPLTSNDPFWEIVGIAKSEAPTDVSRNKDGYLADAYSAKGQ